MTDRERAEFLCAAAVVLDDLRATAASARLQDFIRYYAMRVCFYRSNRNTFWNEVTATGYTFEDNVLADMLGFMDPLQMIEDTLKPGATDLQRRCCLGGFAKLRNVTADMTRMANEYLRDPDATLLLPLSDALEEAGYDLALAEHLRCSDFHTHYYGCWVLDAVLKLRPSMVTTKKVKR